MTSFNVKVVFRASMPAMAEASFERLRTEATVEGFSVPMTGDSYTIWLLLEATDPKIAFSSAIDMVRGAGEPEDVDIERVEIFSIKDADRERASLRPRATA